MHNNNIKKTNQIKIIFNFYCAIIIKKIILLVRYILFEGKLKKIIVNVWAYINYVWTPEKIKTKILIKTKF